MLDTGAANDAHAARLTLPANRALLAGVHILCRTGSEKECLHVLGEKAPRLRIHDIESIVIDQHRLLTHPLGPTVLADLGHDAGSNRSRKRSLVESSAGLSAPDALHVSHSRGNRKPGSGLYGRAYSTFAS